MLLNLLKKIFKEKLPSYPVEGVDFELFEADEFPSQYLVRILKGTFKGLEYGYATVSFLPVDSKDPGLGARLNYKISITFDPRNPKNEDTPERTAAEKGLLHHLIGDIALVLLAADTDKLAPADDVPEDAYEELPEIERTRGNKKRR